MKTIKLNGKSDMKQFNLEEYQKNPNRKVITRDGRNVRIICTDKRKDDYPILALCSMDSRNLERFFQIVRLLMV